MCNRHGQRLLDTLRKQRRTQSATSMGALIQCDVWSYVLIYSSSSSPVCVSVVCGVWYVVWCAVCGVVRGVWCVWCGVV